MKVTKYVKEFLSHLEMRQHSFHTIKNYTYSLKNFPLSLENLTSENIQKEIDGMSYQPGSVNTKVIALSSFIKYLMRNNIIKQNPLDSVVLPNRGSPLPKALEYDEVIDVLEKCAQLTGFRGLRDRAIMELGYATGARADDLVEAIVEGLNMEKKTLRVVGKRKVEAILMFGAPAQLALQEYLEVRKLCVHPYSDDRLFIQENGQPLVSIYHIVKRLSGHGPHVFMRHSAATHMIENGADIQIVSKFLRHKSLDTTMIYTRLTDTKLRRQYGRYHPRGV